MHKPQGAGRTGCLGRTFWILVEISKRREMNPPFQGYHSGTLFSNVCLLGQSVSSSGTSSPQARRPETGTCAPSHAPSAREPAGASEAGRRGADPDLTKARGAALPARAVRALERGSGGQAGGPPRPGSAAVNSSETAGSRERRSGGRRYAPYTTPSKTGSPEFSPLERRKQTQGSERPNYARSRPQPADAHRGPPKGQAAAGTSKNQKRGRGTHSCSPLTMWKAGTSHEARRI